MTRTNREKAEESRRKMCLLALCFRIVDDAPLIVGANREEFYNRPAQPPQILDGPARAVAGVDMLAGGTWLGVNEHGLLVAVTNRPKTQPPAKPRSRGLLVRELLGCQSTKAALDLATQELDAGCYAGCNIVIGDGERLSVFLAGDWLRIKPLPPGVHVLTNDDVNDGNDPRVMHSWDFLNSRLFNDADECVDALRQLCRQTGNGTPPILLRKKDRGTVSSTLVALRNPLAHSIYLHAHGPPDTTPYEDFAHLLAEIGK